MPKRMRRTTMWVYVAAALLPLAVFSLLMLWVFNVQQHNSLEAIMREAASSAGYAVDNQVGDTVAVLTALASSAEFQAEDWPGFGRRVQRVVEGAGWLNLAVTDARRQLYNLHGASQAIDEVGMAEALKTGHPAVSNLIPPGENNTEPAVIVRIPVFNAGRPARTLAAFLPSSTFNRLLREHLPDKWITTLADRNGIILARSRAADTFVGTPLPPIVFDAWRTNRGRVFDAVTKDGVLAYARVTSAGANGWALVMGAPKAEVEGPFRFARHALWISGLAAGLLTVLLADTFLRVVEKGREAERARAAADTERRLGERMADLAHRLSFALESAGAATWDWHVATRRLECSREVETLAGLSAGDLTSYRAWLRLVQPYARRRATAYIRTVLTGRLEDFRLEFPIRHPLVGERWLVAVGRPSFAAAGGVLRIGGICIDITSRRSMEAQLEAAVREAQRANQAKSRFLASASHDIRQPIQSLLLFAHALRTKLDGHPVAPLVGKISAALDALKQLLDSILDISKLDAGLVKVERVVFPVQDLLDKLADAYQPRMAAAGLRFRVVPCSAWVASDPTLLARVVGNLLENALKYTEQGGVVLGCRRRDGRLAVCVCDSGVGLAPEDQQTVFEEFVQIGRHGRDRAQGLGLGLATVKRVAALMGNPIGVRSRPGRGSGFWIEVGTALPPAPGAVAEDCAICPVGGQYVLVVDDESAILEGMRVILEAAGHHVEVAGSADEAVERVRTGFRPDIVVTDYRLPSGRNGTEVISRVREACRRTVPCIVLTGDTELAAADLPATTLMHKPVDPGALQHAIGQHCRAA